VRWWALFVLSLSAWLLVQGLVAVSGEPPRWRVPRAATVHLMPATFVAFALVRGYSVPAPYAAAVLLASAATIPITLRGLYAAPAVAWQAGMWLVGSVLLWRSRGAYFAEGMGTRFGRAAIVVFLGVLPAATVAGLLLAGDRFFVVEMPLALVAMQGLIFVGVVRVRLGDIEVRAVRTGELATDAAQRERLAVVGEVAAALAHEVRNPLAGVRSLAQRVADEDVDASRRRRYAGVIVEEVERVDGIITKLLALARRHAAADVATRLAPVPMLLDDLALLTASRAERKGVNLHLDAAGVARLAPREPLAQVLLNLLLNAIEQSPPGGRVDLLASERDRAVEIVVRDQGPGVAADERERIFAPFYSRTGGTGLGLAVVQRVVAEHGWSIVVRESPGGGAEFWLRVPDGNDATPRRV
jgi:signal transduction histidine kinase